MGDFQGPTVNLLEGTNHHKTTIKPPFFIQLQGTARSSWLQSQWDPPGRCRCRGIRPPAPVVTAKWGKNGGLKHQKS